MFLGITFLTKTAVGIWLIRLIYRHSVERFHKNRIKLLSFLKILIIVTKLFRTTTIKNKNVCTIPTQIFEYYTMSVLTTNEFNV